MVGLLFAAVSPMLVLAEESEQSGKCHRKGPPDFSQLDLDSSGGISLDEFKRHRIRCSRYERVFDYIDANSDGSISEQELADHKPHRGSEKNHHYQQK